MLWWILTAVLAALLLWLLWDEEQAVDRLPGPRRWPVIGCALTFFNLQPRELFLLLRQYCKNHGDRFLIKVFKRRILHLTNPADIEVILAHSKNITKGKGYTFIEPWLGTGLLLSTGSKWHKRRKILTPTFHFNILKNFSGIMEEKSRGMVEKLKAEKGGRVDVLSTISDYSGHYLRALNPSPVTEELASEFGTKNRLAMLDLLLEEESKANIDLEGIREEVNTFMFEGHDTTAMALTFALMLLADHEEVQERVYEECQNIFGDSDRTPSMADMAEMKYLDAVIKETLRLYPSVPFIARKITEDFMLGDLPVKSGTEVAVHIYDLHRRAELFPDPEAFDPGRFLSKEARHPYAYVPFSAGPRNCIGQRFAILEMKCVLSEIARAFKLRPVERDARPALISDMVLRPTQPVYVDFVPR